MKLKMTALNSFVLKEPLSYLFQTMGVGIHDRFLGCRVARDDHVSSDVFGAKEPLVGD